MLRLMVHEKPFLNSENKKKLLHVMELSLH